MTLAKLRYTPLPGTPPPQRPAPPRPRRRVICPLSTHRRRAQLPAELLRVAGRAACKRALRTLRFQIGFILYGDPLAEPEEYTNTGPDYPQYYADHLRHCMTADDLRNMDGGRAVAYATPPPLRELRWQFPEPSAAERHLAAKVAAYLCPNTAPRHSRPPTYPPLPFTLPLITPHPCLRPRNRSIRPSTAPRWRLKFYTHTVTSTGAHETTRIQRVRYSTRFLQRAVCVLTAIRGTRPIGFRSRAP